MPLTQQVGHLLAALFANRRQFQREWKSWRGRPVGSSGIEGPWLGRWVSEANQHTGQLRCVLTVLDSSRYRAVFHATYWKWLSASYAVTLEARQTEGKTCLEGEIDLGRLAGGLYHYAGEATSTSFRCTYRCQYDQGRFELSRSA